MEPDFISEQVKNVWRVIAANAKLIADKKLTIEVCRWDGRETGCSFQNSQGAFVDPNFVLGQAVALHHAVLDSVNIQQNIQQTVKDGSHQASVLKVNNRIGCANV